MYFSRVPPGVAVAELLGQGLTGCGMRSSISGSAAWSVCEKYGVHQALAAARNRLDTGPNVDLARLAGRDPNKAGRVF
jgi:hypothetical protein